MASLFVLGTPQQFIVNGTRVAGLDLLHFEAGGKRFFPLFLSKLDATVIAVDQEVEGYRVFPYDVAVAREAISGGLAVGTSLAVVFGFSRTSDGHLLRNDTCLSTQQILCTPENAAWLMGSAPKPAVDVLSLCRHALVTRAPPPYLGHLEAINAMSEPDHLRHAHDALWSHPGGRAKRLSDGALPCPNTTAIFDPFA